MTAGVQLAVSKSGCMEVFIVRREEEIFADLLSLCGSPGYVHALSLLSFRDNFVRFQQEIKAKDMDHLFSRTRLIRTEIATLVGLMIRKPIDFRHPRLSELEKYMFRTEVLLQELHDSMSTTMFMGMLGSGSTPEPSTSPDISGAALREPIFYGGESAYGFQYRHLAAKKYASDDAWLLSNMGFKINDAIKVVTAVSELQDKTVRATQRALQSIARETWTMLPGFTFSAEEVSKRSELEIDIVKKILNAFAISGGDTNAGFKSLSDYNAVNGTPLLRNETGEYISLQQYSLFEALYETPFYWLNGDRKYVSTAMVNRGRFTEAFALECLAKVFGTRHVYANVDIWRNKAEKLGEIDILVVFGDRAIVLQGKSKRLTLEARRGNDLQIKDDFKKAIQESYDQAYLCSTALTDNKLNLTDALGQPIILAESVKKVYPVCLVSDHYPALSFQSRQFLKSSVTKHISPPLVTDVFAFDAMTEMLESPLRLLSYLELRAKFGDKLIATHELTMLSYHLKRNLWLNDEFDMVMLEDDIAADLDIAMIVRREGLPGRRTPDGILTRIRNTAVGRLIDEIEALPDASTIDLGMLLLELNEDTVGVLNKGIRQITAETKRDGKKHDVTIGLGTSSSGLTIHCNPGDLISAQNALLVHCEARKYSQKSDRWFGLVLRSDGSVWFGLKLEFPWAQDSRMDDLMQRWPKTTMRPAATIGTKGVHKIGRNAPCPCGSGKKYKKCCLNR